jgi:hypothetical protein
MTRKRWALLLMLVACAGVVGVWLLWPRSSVINAENAAKIHAGMTRTEVEALLGGPARDDRSGPGISGGIGGAEEIDDDETEFWKLVSISFEPEGNHPNVHFWKADYIAIGIIFDTHQLVSRKGSVGSWPQHGVGPSPLELLRRWLRL